MAANNDQKMRDIIVKRAKFWKEIWHKYPNRREWFWAFMMDTSGWRMKWGTNVGECMAGASECWQAAGLLIGYDKNADGYVETDERTATPATAIDWGQQMGLWTEKGQLPLPGDILFTNEGKNGHAAVVVEMLDNDRFKTIEFNLSDSVGSRVWAITDSRITGYISPHTDLAMFV